MRKRKHRLCTTLLCTVLIISNVLSVGTPVYAKSSDPGSSIANTITSTEAMPSAAEDGSGTVPADSSEAASGTDNSSESGPADDSENGTPGTDEGAPTPVEPGAEEPDQTEDPGQTENPAAPDDPENPGVSDDPSNPDSSDKTEKPDTSDTPADTDNPDHSGNEPETEASANSGEDVSVSDNDIDEEELPEDEILYLNHAEDTSEYLTEDPRGYNLSDIEMTPGSYAADFSASSKSSLSDYYFKIIYTDDASLAEDFFKGKSNVKESDISSSDFTLVSFDNLNSKYNSTSSLYNVSASFTGNDGLSPETTYFYRLVCYSWNSTEQAYCYSFLTVPMKFTTKSALETSSVKITDISAEEIGYQYVKVVWTVENPNNETLFDIQLSCTDGTENGSNNYYAARNYTDEQYNIVPNKYYVTLNLGDIKWIKDATAQLTTYVGNKEANTVSSETIPLALKGIEDAKIELTEKTGSGTFQALLKLSPYYTVDGSISFKLYYRQKATAADSASSWQSRQDSVYGSKDTDSATGTLKLENLAGSTDYEYYIEPQGTLAAGDFSEILGSEQNPRSFTTKEIRTYTKEDFPDEIFFNYIKKQTNTTGDGITSDKLEKLTQISYSRNSASGNISSLQGIEYIENLTSISLEGHTITNVGGLSSLKELTSINLNYNDLTQLPDLSGMAQLRNAYFGNNLISADSVTADKVPASLLANNSDWITDTIQNQRRADIAVTFAPEYYAAGDTQPFLVKIEGLKKDSSRKYTLSLTLDGKTVSADPTSYAYNDMYYIKDILKDTSGADTGIAITEGTPYTVSVTLTDSYGHTWLDGKTAQVTFAGSSTPVVKTQYIKPNVSSVNINIDNLPTTYTSENIASISLKDQAGKTVGNASQENINFNESYYNPYEDTFGSVYISNITDKRNVSIYANIYFAKYLTAGDYKAVITMNDQTSVTFEKAVCVDDIAVIESLYPTSSDTYYDNYGDYLYVSLNGTNIDPAKIYPVLYENGKAVTKCINGVPGRYNNQYVYKLQKLEKETSWNFSGSKSFPFDFTAVQGYEYISNIKASNKQISIYLESNDFVTFEHYNYKKGIYEVKTNSTVENGTQVSVSVYNSNSYAETSLKGTAEGTVTDSLLSLVFTDAQGETYAPPKDTAAYFRYTYTNAEGEEQTFDHTNSSVEWYNYYISGTSSKSSYTNMVLYHKAALKELAMDVSIPEEKINAESVVTAQITNTSGTAAGSNITLTKGSGSKGYAKYTGTWKSDTGLGEGLYSIRFLLDNKSVYTTQLYVYDDTKFYMNNQWMNTWSSSSGKGVSVAFSSEQLAGNYIHDYNRNVSADQALAYWNKGGYKLELFDRLGNPVTGWKVDHASWNGSNFYLYLKDVPEGYVGFYAKVTRTGSLGIRLDDNNIYYATAYNANEQYGEWDSFGSSNVWFNDLAEINAYYCVGSYAYPVTVTITRPYDTAPIDTFTVSKAANGYFYYFTASDLSKTDPKEAYRITAVSVDGSSRSEIGYLGVRGSQGTVVNPTGVTLNKTTLNLQLDQSEKLTATVKPDNATNKNVTWSSDNTAVATVDSQGNVTAKAIGTAKITVTTDNGKTATCTVNVFNYTLSEISLTFDLTSAEPATLTVSDGTNDISSSVTWSSTDESVATVTKGTVTPISSGTATILAAIKNGPTLECKVIVTRTSLDSASLNTGEITLNVSDPDEANRTKQLKLYLIPNDLEAVEKITWTSNQPSIVSVTPQQEEDTRSTSALVTAVAKGEATITVVVTTKNGNSLPPVTCVVTVEERTVTTEQDALDNKEKNIPNGLSALTNEQLFLNEVTLPTGWTWKYPNVSLKQFAGMQKKSFMAQYEKEEGAVPYEMPLNVSLSTVTGIAITDANEANGNTLHTDSTPATLSIRWIRNGNELDMSGYADKISWRIDKTSIASLSASTGETITVTPESVGKAVVTAEIRFNDGKTYKAQYKLTVTDDELAEIQVVSIDSFNRTSDTAAEVYSINMSSPNAVKTSILHVTATNSTKLTIKNSSSKVVQTGKVTASESSDPATNAFDIPLIISASGRTKVTLTANDKAKTQKEIWLDVTDARPNISEDTVTVNLQKTTGSTFFLYPNTGYTNAAELPTLGGEAFTCFKLEHAKAPDNSDIPNGYIITAKEGTESPAIGSYKLSLSGKTISGGTEYPYTNLSFTVKVIDQKPKYKLKQSSKINLFFSDWESQLEVTSDETIKNIMAAETDTSDFTVENFLLKAKSTGLDTNCNKKMKITLQFEGYKEITADYTVSVEKKAPKATINSKSVTLYPSMGLHTAQLDPKVIMPAGYTFKGLIINLDPDTNEKGLTLITENDKLWLRNTGINQNMTIKAKLIMSNDLWADDITLPLTIKINTGKPALKLQKKSLQLNTNKAFLNYDMASTEVMWKDGAAFAPEGISISAADAKAQNIINSGIVFSVDKTGSRIIAKLNNTTVAKGNYKFKVNVRLNSTTTISTPFSVKVVDMAENKSIKISSKGSIDVLNREGTAVVVTASLKSLNGTVTAASLTGNAAHLFMIDSTQPIKDNKIILRAKAGEALITKYPYKVKLNLTIENAEGDQFYYQTPDISLKLKQSKPKVTITPKNAVFFSGAYNNAVTRKITATLKGADNPVIDKVDLLNDGDGAFVCDIQNDTFTLRSTEKSIKDKNYTLQLKVTFKDQADNEKATIIKYSVKVK